MPIYSFGPESPVKFLITDKKAELYNQAVVEFLRAQQRFNQRFGKPWDPKKSPIKIKWSNGQREAWNYVANLLNRRISEYGPIPATDFTDDFLIKKAPGFVAAGSQTFGRVLTLAVGCGVLHGLLRGRKRPSGEA